jgi:IS30 family transposase
MELSPSTVSREMAKVRGSYCAVEAQKISRERSFKRRVGKFKITGELEGYVQEKLKLDWSPDQISKTLNKKLSLQTVYRYVMRDKADKGELWKHLRILRKQRKDRKLPTWKANWSNIPERVDLMERPSVVEKRSRLGDVERDLVLGKVNGPALLTIVDRRSRLVRIMRVENKCAEEVHWATVEALRGAKIYTITNDNGSEFASHYFTAQDLNCQIYFSRAYRAWERGTNENLNGLLRQYFPRKTSLAEVTPERIKEVENLLNTRPRKCLGYKTPLEVHSAG